MLTEEEKLQLIKDYAEIAALTKPKCEKCRIPLSCCDSLYCGITEQWAKQMWDVTLERTDNKRLPFMGHDGCVVAPHLRPVCSIHTCNIANVGCEPKDPEWTETYFSLRTRIEEAEAKRGVDSPSDFFV